jgi:hypothetical protein
MKLKTTLASTFAALAVVGGAAGTAQASDDDNGKFENSAQILSCDTVEVIDIPIISSANNNIDCSKNHEKKESHSLQVGHESDDARAAVVAPGGQRD